MTIDLSATVDRFSVEYTIRSRAAATAVDGELVEGAESSRTIQALIYPMTGKELRRLPENERSSDMLTIFSSEEIVSQSQAAKVPAEILEFAGVDYEFDKVEPWSAQGKYWQARATRKGRG